MRTPAVPAQRLHPWAPGRTRTYRVHELGAGAAAALAPKARGEVLAVFRRSFYVAMAGDGLSADALACVGPPGLGSGPLNVLCALPEGTDWEAAGLQAGAAVRAGPNALEVGTHLRFVLAGARHWTPHLGTPPDAAALAAGLAHLAVLSQESLPPRGWGVLIPNLVQGTPVPPPASDVEAHLLRQAQAGATALAEWLHTAAEDGPAPMAAAASERRVALLAALLGLGPGLTPAGDDFLGGALVALHHLGRSNDAGWLAERLLPPAAQRTGRISAAHLGWSARGHGSGALHDALRGLSDPGASPALPEALAALDGIGHTSGWDALTGAVTVAAAAGIAPTT